MPDLDPNRRAILSAEPRPWSGRKVLAVVVSISVHAAAFAGVNWDRGAVAPAYVSVVPVEFVDTVSLVGPLNRAEKIQSIDEIPADERHHAAADSAIEAPADAPVARLEAAAGPLPEPRARPEPSDRTVKTAATQPSSPQEGLGDHQIAQPQYVGPGFSNSAPRYPFSARRRGQEGQVVLRVLVGLNGRSTTVSVYQSSGHRLLDQAAVDAVETWRFRPARDLYGNAVSGYVDVPVLFRLTES
ncbi:MAG: energy transducer TonB [Alphaproteobacteria bacterium]|nr:energy transducer TonB [Alphaproteobacteria bacterium]